MRLIRDDECSRGVTYAFRIEMTSCYRLHSSHAGTDRGVQLVDSEMIEEHELRSNLEIKGYLSR
jgi:hypothetical protein